MCSFILNFATIIVIRDILKLSLLYGNNKKQQKQKQKSL